MIVLQFDGRYQPWACALLGSLALHEPALPVLADTVNVDAGQERELRQSHPLVEIRRRGRHRPPAPWQMANRKPFVLRAAIERHPEAPWYALLDADMLVRRALPELWGLLDRAPLGLFQSDGSSMGRYMAGKVFNSSIVLVRRDGRALVDAWCRWARHGRPLGEVGPGRWFWDQATLLMAWCENPQLDTSPLPMALYADWRLSAESAIWSAHAPAGGKDRYQDRFRRELERMRCETGAIR